MINSPRGAIFTGETCFYDTGAAGPTLGMSTDTHCNVPTGITALLLLVGIAMVVMTTTTRYGVRLCVRQWDVSGV